MTPKLPVVTGKELARVAQRLGFEFRRQKGSHAIYIRSSDQRRVVIPMHSGHDLNPKTLRGILGELGCQSGRVPADVVRRAGCRYSPFSKNSICHSDKEKSETRTANPRTSASGLKKRGYAVECSRSACSICTSGL